MRLEEGKTDTTIYLPDGVSPEKRALDEVNELLGLEQTVERLKKHGNFFGEKDSRIEKMIFIPNFHKDAGILIGTVVMTKGFAILQAKGNDINCGLWEIVARMEPIFTVKA